MRDAPFDIEDLAVRDQRQSVGARVTTADPSVSRRSTYLVLGGLIALAVIFAVLARDSSSSERAEVAGQGGSDPLLAIDGARLQRSEDGLRVTLVVPRPAPGTYEYPSAETARGPFTHPEVVPGDIDNAEVFTFWVFVFNNPELCTDDSCDPDDIGEDALARGGVFQADGRIATGDTLRLSGSVRLGQPAVNGAPLENPLGAEVHTGIAPHGLASTGEGLSAQLNMGIGDPTFWWAASFYP